MRTSHNRHHSAYGVRRRTPVALSASKSAARLACINCAIRRKMRDSDSVTYVNTRPRPRTFFLVLHQFLLRERARLNLLRNTSDRSGVGLGYVCKYAPSPSRSILRLTKNLLREEPRLNEMRSLHQFLLREEPRLNELRISHNRHLSQYGVQHRVPIARSASKSSARLACINCAIRRKMRDSDSVTYVDTRPRPRTFFLVLHQFLLRDARLNLLRNTSDRSGVGLGYVCKYAPSTSPPMPRLASKSSARASSHDNVRISHNRHYSARCTPASS